MFRRRNVILNSLLVIVLGVIGFFGWRMLYPPTVAVMVRTVTVSVQDVSTSVSATGSVQTATDVGLNFGTSGIVRQLNVKVGDQVNKGQLLAAVDDRATRLALLQAQVSEKSAEISVKSAEGSVKSAEASVKNAEASVKSAEVSVKNAEASVKNAEASVVQSQLSAQQTQASNDQAIITAQTVLNKLMAGTSTANLAVQAQQLASQQLSIDNAAASYQNAVNGQKQVEDNIAMNLINYNITVTNALYDYTTKCAALAPGTDCTTAVSSRASYLTLQNAQQAKAAGVLKDSQSVANAITAVDSARRSVLNAQASLDTLKAQQAVTNQPVAQSDIDAAQANITAAQRTKATAELQAPQQAIQLAGSVETAQRSVETAQRSVETAQRSVETAQGSLENSKGSVENSKGSVVTAKAFLANAQVNLAKTKLYAPVSATVAAVASAVGVKDGSTTAGSSGASGYIVLTDLSGLQVKASFAEADIVSLRVGQAVTFTFDAISNSSANGEVLSIAPLNNAATGNATVMSYNVIFSLTDAPAGVKPGMTVQANVTTAQALGVLAVTSVALTQRGNNYTVTMKPTTVGGVGVRKVVTIGLQGDAVTEITSGLDEGAQVVLRTTTGTSASSGFPTSVVPGSTGQGGGKGAGKRAGKGAGAGGGG